MHPYDHSRSSVRLFGGELADYQAVHDWFDATKVVLTHFTHRALRHHKQGIDEAEKRFGVSLRNQNQKDVSIRELGAQHVEEDCRFIPSVEGWLQHMTAPEWVPKQVPSAEEIAETEARRLNVRPEDLLPLNRWMLATEEWFEDSRHLSLRHHSFGIFEAEQVFGSVLSPREGVVIPVRYLAERHVRKVLGRIPAASDWLRKIAGQKWMVDAKSPGEILL